MTQNAFLASTAFSNIAVGSTTVSAVYVGSTKIWEAASGVTWTNPDLSNASYDSVSLSISSEETFPTDLAVSSDGTKFYILGAAGYTIDQYNLTTAWDLSTGSYANKTFSTQSQASSPNGLSFKSDGTKVYVADTNNDAIYQYALSTAWDISTASYENKSFNLSSNSPNIGNPYGIQFKSDGSKMYVIGHSTDAVYQYSLSTSWDVSTASYDSVTFATKPQDGGPHALFFAPTGTKFYVVGTVNDKVFEYSLSTAWDLSTSSYSGNSFSIGSQENNGKGLFFKDDGSKMYAVGWQNDTIYQYSTAAAAWTNPDLANASYDSVSLSISGQNQFPTGIFFKDDGTKFFGLLGANTIYQYALSTAWDISTSSYESKSFNSGTQTSFPEAVSFKSDGTIMYVTSRSSTDAIYQYTLSTAWDVSTASYANKYLDVTPQEVNPRAAYFKPDGSKVYVAGTGNDTIYQYALSTAWDVSTGSFETGKSFSVSSQEGSPQSLYFSPSGDKVWTIGTTNQTVYQYSLSTAWDISTASYDSVSFSVSSQDTGPKELFYKSDGSKLYVLGDTNDNIYQYST